MSLNAGEFVERSAIDYFQVRQALEHVNQCAPS